ncbi:MAG: hypothetical protein OHK0012_13410 [Synechococcales cyanobacterium]
MSTIVSYRKKFIFIHITKTAGTSVTSVLEPYGDPPILSSKWVRNSIHILEKWLPIRIIPFTGRAILPIHADAKEITTRYQNVDLHSFYRFSFVRNPWDRVVSLYTFRRTSRKKFTNAKKYEKAMSQSFSEFVEDFCGRRFLSQAERLFLDPQGNLDMDFVGKMENLDQDLPIVLKNLGIPNNSVPRKNRTRHDHYVSLYDSHTKKLVADAFAKDIELFQYRFGEEP